MKEGLVVIKEKTMTNISYLRQLGWFNPNTDTQYPLIIAGCGGIGSYFAFHAAQMGFKNLMLIDFDKVSDINVPNQNFPQTDVGKLKVSAQIELIRRFYGDEIKVQQFPFPIEDFYFDKFGGILVSALDKITPRRYLYEVFKKHPQYFFFLDGRLGGLQADVIAFSRGRHHEYEKLLPSEESVPELPCSQRAIIDVTLNVVSRMLEQLRKYCVNPTPTYHHSTYCDSQYTSPEDYMLENEFAEEL